MPTPPIKIAAVANNQPATWRSRQRANERKWSPPAWFDLIRETDCASVSMGERLPAAIRIPPAANLLAWFFPSIAVFFFSPRFAAVDKGGYDSQSCGLGQDATRQTASQYRAYLGWQLALGNSGGRIDLYNPASKRERRSFPLLLRSFA